MEFLRGKVQARNDNAKATHVRKVIVFHLKKNGDQVLDCMGNRVQRVIHAQFNALNCTYCRVKPGTQQLKCMMNENFTRLHPKSKPVPTRKRKIQTRGIDFI